MMRHRFAAARSSIVLLALVVSACGGDDNPGPRPPAVRGGGGGGTGGTVAATITITATGVSPQERDRRRRFARDVRQQRHPAARHGVGSASGAHRLPGVNGGFPVSRARAVTTQNLNHRAHVRLPRSQSGHEHLAAGHDSDSVALKAGPKGARPYSAVWPGIISNT